MLNVNGTIPTHLIQRWIEHVEDDLELDLEDVSGLRFNLDFDDEPGNNGVVEFAVKVAPGEGDRGMEHEWVDIQNAGGEYTWEIMEEFFHPVLENALDLLEAAKLARQSALDMTDDVEPNSDADVLRASIFQDLHTVIERIEGR